MEQEKQQLAKYGEYMRATNRGTHILRVKDENRGQRLGCQLRFADTVEVQCIKPKPLSYRFGIKKEEVVDDGMTQAETAEFMRRKLLDDLNQMREYIPGERLGHFEPPRRDTINPLTPEEVEKLKAAAKGKRRSEGRISLPVHTAKVDEYGHKRYAKEVAPRKAKSLMEQYHPTVNERNYEDIAYMFAPTVGAELAHQVIVYDPETGQTTIENVDPETMMGMYAGQMDMYGGQMDMYGGQMDMYGGQMDMYGGQMDMYTNPTDQDQQAGTSYYYG